MTRTAPYRVSATVMRQQLATFPFANPEWLATPEETRHWLSALPPLPLSAVDRSLRQSIEKNLATWRPARRSAYHRSYVQRTITRQLVQMASLYQAEVLAGRGP